MDVPKQKAQSSLHEHFSFELERVITLCDEELARRYRDKDNVGEKNLKSIRKTLADLSLKTSKIHSKSKSVKIEADPNKPSGLKNPVQISNELADFLQIDVFRSKYPDIPLTRSEITRALCVYIHLDSKEKREATLRWKHLNPKCARNLQNPNEKNAILPDKNLRILLRIDQYEKDVREGKITIQKKIGSENERQQIKIVRPIVYYYTLQKLIQPHIEKKNKNAL